MLACVTKHGVPERYFLFIDSFDKGYMHIYTNCADLRTLAPLSLASSASVLGGLSPSCRCGAVSCFAVSSCHKLIKRK
jgi:hypothetical protein